MSVPVREGEVLAGKYRIERVLGRGGMGVVVAARHVELDELVALKFLLPEAMEVPEAVARFLKEARAAVRIKSEHVARVHDVGQLENGAPYIVMEYLQGSDLAAVVRSRGALPVEDAVDYLAQTCEAIADAHALGIVHRDLKPSNLMLVTRTDGSDCVKVLDFGISKNTTASGSMAMDVTRTSTILGSPSYMSPEQMMSPRSVDARSDIWSLGAILFELLTARLPFEAETIHAIGILIATAEPTAIRSYRPDLPPGLETVFARCLAKSRDDRFPNVGELAAALAPFAPERSRVSIARAGRIVGPGGRAESDGGGAPLTAPLVQGTPRAPAGVRPDSSSGGQWIRTATWGPTAEPDPGTNVARRRRLPRLALVLGSAGAATVTIATALALRGGAPASPVASERPAAVEAPRSDVPRSSATQVVLPPAPAEASSEPRSALSDPPDAGNVAEALRAPRAHTAQGDAKLPAHPTAGHTGPAPSAPQKKSAYDDM